METFNGGVKNGCFDIRCAYFPLNADAAVFRFKLLYSRYIYPNIPNFKSLKSS